MHIYLDPIVVRDRDLAAVSAGKPDEGKVLEELATQGPAAYLEDTGTKKIRCGSGNPSTTTTRNCKQY